MKKILPVIVLAGVLGLSLSAFSASRESNVISVEQEDGSRKELSSKAELDAHLESRKGRKKPSLAESMNKGKDADSGSQVVMFLVVGKGKDSEVSSLIQEMKEFSPVRLGSSAPHECKFYKQPEAKCGFATGRQVEAINQRLSSLFPGGEGRDYWVREIRRMNSPENGG